MSYSSQVLVLREPRINQETGKLIDDALAQRKTLLLVGNCWVKYKGRASSNLEPGERILIIKEDGAILVHRPTGYEAVNWQPSGCIFQSKVTGSTLQITAIRRNPKESVYLYFDSIILFASMKLEDTGKFSLHATERDMQKAILVEPSMIEVGFRPISFEKKVEPGFVDIYGIDKDGNLVVVEIKRNIAGHNAALQLSRYVKAVQGRANRKVRGLLVAPRISKGTQKLLFSLGLSFKSLDPRKCAEILKNHKTPKLIDFFKKSE